MSNATRGLVGLALVVGMAALPAYAQRGVGDPIGVASRADKPEIVSLSGKLVEIKTGRCEATTGRATVGTHILVETPDGKTLNVHLGPADAIAGQVAKLSVGRDVTVQAFRTDKLKASDFVAQSLTSGDTRIALRDAALRPVWAENRVGTPGSGAALGRSGRGRGPGWGMGMGRGMGMGAARIGGGQGMGCSGPCWGGGAGAQAQAGVAPGAMGMSAAEHGNVFDLLSNHADISRKVEEIPGGIRTATTTTKPELVETLRTHVRQMDRHLEQGQPVRMWDPAFRDVFAHHDEITLVAKDIEGGIEVTETSENPEVVPMIRAHAKKVDAFVAEGHNAARPPWAGQGRGRMMRGR